MSSRRIFLFLSRTLLVVFSIVALFLFFLTIRPGERLLRGILERQIQEYSGQKVQIGELETNLFGRVRIRDIQIYQQYLDQTVPLLILQHAEIRYRISDLFRRRFFISSLAIDGMTLLVRRDRFGSYNIPLIDLSRKPDSGFEKTPISVRLRQLSINNFSVQCEDASIPMELSLQEISCLVINEFKDRYQCSMQVVSGAIKYRDFNFPVKMLEISGLWDSVKWQLENIRLNLSDLRLEGKATVWKKKGDLIVGDFQLRGNPSSLLEGLRRKLPERIFPVNGEFNLSLQLGGTLKYPELKAKVNFPTLALGKLPFRSGVVLAGWKPGEISLEKLTFMISDGRVSGEGRIMTRGLLADKISILLDNIDLAILWKMIYGTDSPYQGNVNGKIVARGPIPNPKGWDVSANLIFNQVKYSSRSIPDFNANLNIQKGRMDFRFQQGASEILAKAELKEKYLSGDFQAKILKLEPLLTLSNVKELNGEIEIYGNISGKWKSPEITANIEGRNIAYQNFPVDSLKGQIRYKERKIYFSKLSAEGNLVKVDPTRPPFHLAGVGGGISYRVRADGPLHNLNASLSLELNQPEYMGYQFDKGYLQCALQDGRLAANTLQLEKDRLFMQATGEYSIFHFKGRCDVRIYEFPSPDINVGDIMVEYIKKMDEKSIKIRPIGNMEAVFDFAKKGYYSLKIREDALEIGKLKGIFPALSDIEGTTRYSLDFSGSFENPSWDINFETDKPKYKLVEIDSVKGNAVFGNNQLLIKNFELFKKGNYCSIEGMIPLYRNKDGRYSISPRESLRVRVKSTGVEVSLLNPFLGKELQISGLAVCDLSCNGTVKNPRLEGNLSIKNGSFRSSPGTPGIEKVSVDISINDSIIDIKQVRGMIKQTPFHLQGRIKSHQWKHFNLNINASIFDFKAITVAGIISEDKLQLDARTKKMDISLLQPFFPELRKLDGVINGEMILTGALKDPQVNGRVEVNGFALHLSGMVEEIREGMIILSFKGKEIKIEEISLRINGGKVLISGGFIYDFKGLSNVNLSAVLQNVKITRPREAIVVVESGDLEYQSKNDYYLLSGGVELGETRFLLDVKPQSLLFRGKTVQETRKVTSRLLQNTRIDLHIKGDKNVWINNNLGRLRLDVDIALIGTLEKPNLTGRISAEEGYVFYLDRKFDIKQGTVDFVDLNRINPVIDFTAEDKVRSRQVLGEEPYIILLSLQGPLDEVVLNLTSTPPLDKPDIVALLTFGATRGQLTGKDVTGRAGEISSRRVTGYVATKVENLLGLENLTIEDSLFRYGTQAGLRLRATKKISRRAELTYTTTVGYFNEQGIRLGYSLSKHFLLESQTVQQGRSNIGLRYRLRLK